ncbi:MAG TPA: DUF2267 domain-containing protein [Anaerolineales bacterium]|nr:DUF2267 domain-containing protein [Anaerolineales bacterium]
MQYDEFVGKVQERARLASSGEAVRAIRATLETLDQRLNPGEAQDLAAQLPREIGAFFGGSQQAETFNLNHFFELVSAKEEVDLPDAVHHARAVIAVLQDAATQGEMANVRAQLPDDWDQLFAAGSEGEFDVNE